MSASGYTYRFVDPQGALRPDGEKLLKSKRQTVRA